MINKHGSGTAVPINLTLIPPPPVQVISFVKEPSTEGEKVNVIFVWSPGTKEYVPKPLSLKGGFIKLLTEPSK